jgi:hypothetical protein
MPLRVYLHFALWCALFAAFVWISAPMVGSAIKENRVGPIETSASIDTYLRTLTGIEHGSERLPNTFRRLGKQGLLVIFVRDHDSPSEFLGMMIGYLSWPHEIRVIKVTETTVEKEVASVKFDSIAGFVFCSVNPPAFLEKRLRLGSDVILVPVVEVAP